MVIYAFVAVRRAGAAGTRPGPQQLARLAPEANTAVTADRSGRVTAIVAQGELHRLWLARTTAR
jgi:hypothetical protein